MLEIDNQLALLRNNPFPARFETRRSVIDIQYFLTAEQQKQQDNDNGLFVFAVNTDGFDLIIDTNSKSADIHQREFGDIDFIVDTLRASIEATLVDLKEQGYSYE